MYAVGADADGNGPLVYHFDGERLERLTMDLPGVTGDLWWLHQVGPDDVRMVGEAGLLLRYRPSDRAFERLHAPSADIIFGVWGRSPDDVWYVGGTPIARSSALWRDRGSGAEALTDGPDGARDATAFKVHGLASGTLWIVGQSGFAAVREEGAWVSHPVDTRETLFTVHGHDDRHVWAVGGVVEGLIRRWDGSAWTDETPPGTPALNGVFAAGPGRTVAGGFNGTLLTRGDDGVWVDFPHPPPTFEDFHSVWVGPDGSVWAAGGLLGADPPTRGVLVRYGVPLGLDVREDPRP